MKTILVRDLVDWDYADEQRAYRDLDGYRIIDAHDRVCIYELIVGGIGRQVAWAKPGLDYWWDVSETTPNRDPRVADAETIERVIDIIKTWEPR